MSTRGYGARPVKRSRRSQATLDELDAVIIKAIDEDAPVTLRGVFYRVAAIGAVSKDDRGYRLVGRQLLKLRRDGRVPYGHITDGTRWVTKPKTYHGLESMLQEVKQSYRRQLWANQAVDVHVFTEKDAISGVILPVTEEFDVPLAVVRGYCSESFAYSLALGIAASHKPVFVYQLGDHDPSGVDAWWDLQRKVMAFAPSADVVFERLAVTPAQIHEMGLPTRPTKTSDTRSREFVGDSVEVDAIPARVLRDLLRDHIESHVDPSQLDITLIAEETERDQIGAIIKAMAA